LLAALVAGDVVALTVSATAASAAAEILTARVAAAFATLRLAQVSFLIIFLFAFREWKRVAALGARDL
jgi:hypothetical protein